MPEDTAAAAPPADDAAPEAPTGEAGAFTQEDVDRIVAERLKRAEPRYAELRQKAEQFDQLQESQKSEQQKLADALAAAQRERDEAVATAHKARLDAAVIRAATGKLHNPALATRLVDADGLDPSDAAAVNAAIDQLLDDSPELGVRRITGGADQGARQPANAGGDMSSIIRRAAGRASA